MRLLRNLLAALILYGNAAVALQPPGLRELGLRVPRTAAIHDAFLMTGMFSSYSLNNLDFELHGLRTQDGLRADRGQWIRLRLREHFARRHGVVFTELFAMRHWDTFGPAAQRRAWTFLARRIRERHNRLHPERAISRVRIGSVQWPQSPLGYRAARDPARLQAHQWFDEGAR